MCLLRSLNNMLNSFETLFPCANLKLDGLPFLELNFSEHMALDDNYFIVLIDLSINDLVLDCINGPRLNLFHVDLETKISAISTMT